MCKRPFRLEHLGEPERGLHKFRATGLPEIGLTQLVIVCATFFAVTIASYFRFGGITALILGAITFIVAFRVGKRLTMH